MQIDRRGGLFIVSAPSGTGKGTVIGAVMDLVSKLSYSVSYTTREPRTGERDGEHYFFVDDARFHQMIGEGAFLEHARVFDKYWYGTARDQVLGLMERGDDVIMDIDVQGALQLIEKDELPHTAIFLIPPSMDELRERLIRRNRDTGDEVDRRLKTAGEELRVINRFHYLVVNDDLDTAVDAVAHIIRTERYRVDRIRDLDRLKKTMLNGGTE